MECRGACTRFKSQKPYRVGYYAAGQKRCQTCEEFIKWDGDGEDPNVYKGRFYDPNGRFCPCCGTRLRTKPRNAKYKARLRVSQGLEV